MAQDVARPIRRVVTGVEPKLRPPGRTWDRGGRNAYTTDMHKTATVDYAIMLEGAAPTMRGAIDPASRRGSPLHPTTQCIDSTGRPE